MTNMRNFMIYIGVVIFVLFVAYTVFYHNAYNKVTVAEQTAQIAMENISVDNGVTITWDNYVTEVTITLWD